MINSNANKTEYWQVLGYLGLIPFLGALVLNFLPLTLPKSALTIFVSYSSIIVSFLAGTLWSSNGDKKSRFKQNVSISISLIAFSCLLLPAYLSLLILAVCFLVVWIVERRLMSTQINDQRYILMRTRLTTIVILCHLAAIYFWLY